MADNFISSNPLLWIVVISFVVTLVTTLIYKYTTDQKRLKEVREQIKRHQEELKVHKNDLKKSQEIQKRLMEMSFEPLKLTLKPLIITFIPIIVIFAWIRNSLPDKTVILKFPFDISKVGDNSGFGWVGVYILTSILFSFIFRKVLKVY